MSFTKTQMLSIIYKRDKILSLCKEFRVKTTRIPFKETVHEEFEYLENSILSNNLLHGYDSLVFLRKELTQLAGWAIATGLDTYKCRMIFNELAKLHKLDSEYQQNENYYFVFSILSEEDNRHFLEYKGNDIQILILNAIRNDNRTLVFKEKNYFGDDHYWIKAYKAFLNNDKATLYQIIIRLAKIWMEDRNYDYFSINNKYYCFFELYPNALLSLLTRKLNWEISFDDKSIENFYLPALAKYKEPIIKVNELTILGVSFDYGEDTICLGDGGGYESFILEQAIFRAIIDFGAQADFMTKDLSFKAYTYCDYAELNVEQLDKDTVNIYSQFHDGSEREEIQCSSTIFYSAFFKYLDSFFETVFSDAELAEKVKVSFKYMANNYTLVEHHSGYKMFKSIIKTYYSL